MVKLREKCCLGLLAILVMPATNSVSEQSFSSLRRVKNYLRSTMTENRLNHVMMYTSQGCDRLPLISVANKFIRESKHRQSIFGTFIESDYSCWQLIQLYYSPYVKVFFIIINQHYLYMSHSMASSHSKCFRYHGNRRCGL